MSSCLSGAGRTYGFDLEIVKSPSSWTRTSQTSSPSSTLSESSNSPLAISTRKPRTPRKRPNQTYNEAAALLSTAYPNIFSTKNLTNPRKFTKQHDSFFDESPELLLPFRVIDSSGFLLHQPIQEKPNFLIQPKIMNSCEKLCQSPGEIEFNSNSMELCNGYQEDFDAESILDEEIEGSIDSIMGNLRANSDTIDESNSYNSWCGNPMMGLEFGGKSEFGFGMRRGVSALRCVDEGNWWCFPTVDVLQISPKFNKVSVSSSAEKKKKKKKVENTVVVESENPELSPEENSVPAEPNSSGLLLKLNYDDVLDAWSDRGAPIPDEILGSESGTDAYARLAQIDLFSESGGVREASVLRYKEKRRTRLFSKKIRYQVRKVNADRRPRMKGRFVRRPNSSSSGQR